PQVDLLLVVGGRGALGELLVAQEVVLALELLDFAHAHLQLMRDPGVGATLSYPGADLVEVRAQGFPGHLECGETSALSLARGPGWRRHQNGTILRCLRHQWRGRWGFPPRGSLSPGAGVMLGSPVVGGLAPDCCQRKGARMLVLTRKSNQSIMIGDDVEVSVLSVMGEKVRIGIQAPQEIPVFSKEIYVEIHREDADGVLDEAKRAEVNDALGEVGED